MDNSILSFLSTELKIRIISALFLVAAVSLFLWLGGATYVLMWAVLAFFILFEYLRMVSNALSVSIRLCATIFLCLIVVSFALGDHFTAYLIAALGATALAAWELVTSRTLWASGGLLYSSLPFLAFSNLRGDVFDGVIATLFIFAIVWGADVAAYFSGRYFGGAKLAPKISPNKTWSGFFGGLLGSLILCFLLAKYMGYDMMSSFWMFVIAASIVSQIGDLVESFIKRRFKVKDSGSIIPGHGGILDRIDGLVFAGVFAWGLLLLIGLNTSSTAPIAGALKAYFILP